MSESEPRIAWAYLRVSTDRQTFENQRNQLRDYAEKHGFWIPEDRWYIDDDTHGFIPAMEREQFSKLHDDLTTMPKDGLPSHVAMYEVSRLGRTFWETLDAIKFLEDLSPIISSSPKEAFLQVEDRSMRNLFLGILAWAAEREREVLVQRVIDGVARAHKEGKHSGNIPLGYKLEGGKLILDAMGEKAWNLYSTNERIKPVQVQKELLIGYKQAWNLLKSIKQFWKP